VGTVTHGSSSGFTIIELMFVVVIIMVLASLAVPTFVGVGQTDRLVQATDEVQRAFELARARAVLMDAPMRIRIVKASGDATPNIRVDESPDATCYGFQRIARRATNPDLAEESPANPCSAWLPAERHRCGISNVHITGTLAWGGYRETSVTILDVTTGSGTADDPLVLCMNRRGRLLSWDGTGWAPLVGGLRFRLDRRQGTTGPFLNLVKTVEIPQGGIAGVMR
jgi:type II secretory pathway pseudopilin PulG